MKKTLLEEQIRYTGDLNTLCEYGFILYAPKHSNIVALSNHLVVSRIRGKYILEFKDPSETSLYTHFMKYQESGDPSLETEAQHTLRLLLRNRLIEFKSALKRQTLSEHRHVLIVEPSLELLNHFSVESIRTALISMLRSKEIYFEKHAFMIRTANVSFHFHYDDTQSLRHLRKQLYNKAFLLVDDVIHARFKREVLNELDHWRTSIEDVEVIPFSIRDLLNARVAQHRVKVQSLLDEILAYEPLASPNHNDPAISDI